MASLTYVLRAANLNGRLRADLTAEGGIVRGDLQRRARNVRDEARRLARARSQRPTGELEHSIRYVTEDRGSAGLAAQVGSDSQHALWAEEGTGVFGPHRHPIVPRRAPFLVFSIEGTVIRTRSVRGQPGKHYLRDALEAAAP